jgi:predicted Rossmann-fold nucleotide-binding protein
MLQNTDVHIVFNGSLGTLSEFGMTWISSWIHEPDSKPIILFGNFWKDVIDVLGRHMIVEKAEKEMVVICTTPSEVLAYLERLERNSRKS